MSISQNFPEEGPTLNLNFAGSRTLDPRITFTRTSSATYMGRDGLVKIAPANSARFDHRYNPTTGEIESLGLLVEEQRTNLITYSEDFSIWTKQTTSPGVVGITTTTETTSPDGTFNAYKYFIEESGGSFYAIFRGASSISANVVYAYSVYVKSAELNRVVLSLADSSGGPNCAYDLTTGLPLTPFGSTNTTIHTVKMDSYSNGWYRCSMSFSNSIDNNVSQIKIGLPGPTFTQNNGIYIWGAQLEVGSFPTSYIPTTTSTVTRTADNASITGSNFTDFYNPSEGTIVLSARVGFATAVQTGYLTVYNSSNSGQNRLSIRIANTLSDTNGVSQLNYTNTPSQIPGTYVKIATTYKKNDYAQYANGNLIQTDNTVEVPIGVNTMEIGAVEGVTTLDFNSTISQITYYPNRLSNSQLIALTK